MRSMSGKDREGRVKQFASAEKNSRTRPVFQAPKYKCALLEGRDHVSLIFIFTASPSQLYSRQMFYKGLMN